jgi:hypothetical protein
MPILSWWVLRICLHSCTGNQNLRSVQMFTQINAWLNIWAPWSIAKPKWVIILAITKNYCKFNMSYSGHAYYVHLVLQWMPMYHYAWMIYHPSTMWNLCVTLQLLAVSTRNQTCLPQTMLHWLNSWIVRTLPLMSATHRKRKYSRHFRNRMLRSLHWLSNY